jgi:uncharacterized protein YjcR
MKQQEILTPKVRLKAYSLKELAQLYECSPKTMKTWLIRFEKEIEPRMGYFYTPKQIKIIFEKLGIPGIFHLN